MRNRAAPLAAPWLMMIGAAAPVLAGIAIGATVDLGSDESQFQRTAPLIAGAALSIGIGLLMARPGIAIGPIRLTYRARVVLVSLAAIGFLLGMFAVSGWILSRQSLCPFASTAERELIERGALDIEPCGGYTSEQRAVMVAGAIGAASMVAATRLRAMR